MAQGKGLAFRDGWPVDTLGDIIKSWWLLGDELLGVVGGSITWVALEWCWCIKYLLQQSD